MDLFLYDRDLRDERGKRNLQALYSILKFKFLYPFHAIDLFLYPLKTLKNLFIFSFQGVWKENSAMKWVNALRTPPEINKLNIQIISKYNFMHDFSRAMMRFMVHIHRRIQKCIKPLKPETLILHIKTVKL